MTSPSFSGAEPDLAYQKFFQQVTGMQNPVDPSILLNPPYRDSQRAEAQRFGDRLEQQLGQEFQSAGFGEYSEISYLLRMTLVSHRIQVLIAQLPPSCQAAAERFFEKQVGRIHSHLSQYTQARGTFLEDYAETYQAMTGLSARFPGLFSIVVTDDSDSQWVRSAIAACYEFMTRDTYLDVLRREVESLDVPPPLTDGLPEVLVIRVLRDIHEILHRLRDQIHHTRDGITLRTYSRVQRQAWRELQERREGSVSLKEYDEHLGMRTVMRVILFEEVLSRSGLDSEMNGLLTDAFESIVNEVLEYLQSSRWKPLAQTAVDLEAMLTGRIPQIASWGSLSISLQREIRESITFIAREHLLDLARR